MHTIVIKNDYEEKTTAVSSLNSTLTRKMYIYISGILRLSNKQMI